MTDTMLKEKNQKKENSPGIRYGGSIRRNGVIMQLEIHSDRSRWLVIKRDGETEGRFMRLPIDRDGWDAVKKFIGN